MASTEGVEPRRGVDPRYPAREAPADPALYRPGPEGADPTHPAVPEEPVLRLGEIQGNVLAGFRKDHQTLLFLEIEDPELARAWLRELVPFIATTEDVLAFNGLFKALRDRRGFDPPLEVTWLNVAFSFAGLRKLRPDAEGFTDAAFRAGLAARSERLGDPVEGEGSPASWVVGGPEDEADLVLIVAGDDPEDLAAEVDHLEAAIFGAPLGPGPRAPSGLGLRFKQHGATLPSPLAGHEHFGFLDGISQPGVRGRLSEHPADVLTPRQNPHDADQGKPGQDLLWPGEFVFGYPGQDPSAPEISVPGPVTRSGAGAWTDDGSFLVFRRLRQDVRGFRDFLRTEAARLKVDPELLGAKIVGRWKSGAPIMLAPAADDEELAGDDRRNNLFEFAHDAEGARCPFGAHIRKAYPRDDVSPDILELGEASTQTHRMLRRGSPYGDPFPAAPQDTADRGLLFLAYQTSIEDGFEFVQRAWANHPGFKQSGAGQDLVIGQGGRDRARSLTVPLDGEAQSLQTMADWVTPTGGGYFFAPSIAGLRHLAGG